ncbi:hypothetical protein ACQBAU_16055 [Propionibacteriaceae bacterium Y2011]
MAPHPFPTRRLVVGLGLAGAVLLASCTGPTTTPPAPSTPPGTVVPATAGPSGPSGSSSPGAGPSSTPTPRAQPPRPTAQAASTAGSLTAADLPAELPGGFRPDAREAAEGEYVPNGTWVHEVPGEQASWEAMPPCEANPGGGWPVAQHALAGTYADAQGRPGNGLVLQFADAGQAAAYARTYREVLGSCPEQNGMPAAAELESEAAWYAGRRSYGPERWSEVVAHSGPRVWLVIINDAGATEPTELATLARSLVGR